MFSRTLIASKIDYLLALVFLISPLFGYVVHKDLAIGGVMVRMLVDRVVGLNQRLKLVFVASRLSTQYIGVRAKTGWLGIRMMCPSGATCLTADCCFSELALEKSNLVP